jgi:hypothetical protein
MAEIATASTTNGLWQTIVARPGLMVKRGTYSGEASIILGGTSGSFIRSDELALALIDAAQHGGEDLLLAPMLLRRGRELVKLGEGS